MRRIGICALMLLCVLMTMPVMAAEGGPAKGMGWGAVVEWLQGVVVWITGEGGTLTETDGLNQGESEGNGDAGPHVEPDGLAHEQSGSAVSLE